MDSSPPPLFSKPMTPEAIRAKYSSRNHSVLGVLQLFADSHLHEELYTNIAGPIKSVAFWMMNTLPDGPELTIGLRELLSARGAFINQYHIAGNFVLIRPETLADAPPPVSNKES